jgi:hypothetical protein
MDTPEDAPPFPIQPVTVPNAGWTREMLDNDASLYFHLTPDEITDMQRVLNHLKANHAEPVNLFSLLPGDFPIGDPTKRLLDMVRRELLTGRGFQTLRGFPVAQHTVSDLRLLWFGLGMHLGVARPQGKTSLYIADVLDIGTDYRGTAGRGYTSNAPLDFHSDGSDVVGLFCLKTAVKGGESLISSSIRAHNEMLRLRPDLLAELYKPMTFGRQTEEAPEEPPYYECPIMGVAGDGSWSCRFIRNHIRVAQLTFKEIPRLTAKQIEAMDMFDRLLGSDELCYRSYKEPGDMEFMLNHTVLHSRTGYVDHKEPEKRRHLLRLWLSIPEAPQLPDGWKLAYKDVEARSLRGGFRGQAITEEIRNWEERMSRWHGIRNRVYEDREAHLARKGKL